MTAWRSTDGGISSYRLTAVPEKQQLSPKIEGAFKIKVRRAFSPLIAWRPINGEIGGKAVRAALSHCSVYRFSLTAVVFSGLFPYRCFFNDFNDLTALHPIRGYREEKRAMTRAPKQPIMGKHKGEALTFLSGAICRRCAGRPSDELMTAVVGYLRALKPDATIIKGGSA